MENNENENIAGGDAVSSVMLLNRFKNNERMFENQMKLLEDMKRENNELMEQLELKNKRQHQQIELQQQQHQMQQMIQIQQQQPPPMQNTAVAAPVGGFSYNFPISTSPFTIHPVQSNIEEPFGSSYFTTAATTTDYNGYNNNYPVNNILPIHHQQQQVVDFGLIQQQQIDQQRQQQQLEQQRQQQQQLEQQRQQQQQLERQRQQQQLLLQQLEYQRQMNNGSSGSSSTSTPPPVSISKQLQPAKEKQASPPPPPGLQAAIEKPPPPPPVAAKAEKSPTPPPVSETATVKKPTAAEVLKKVKIVKPIEPVSEAAAAAAAGSSSSPAELFVTPNCSSGDSRSDSSGRSSVSDENVSSTPEYFTGETIKQWKTNVFGCLTSKFSNKPIFVEVYIIASCVFQLAASTRSRTLDLVGKPYSSQRATNVSYNEIKVPETSRKTFDNFRKSYGTLSTKVNARSLLEFIIDTMSSTPILVSSNFVSLFSLRKNKILNSIISFENLGKTCQSDDCQKIAAIVIEDKAKGSKSIFCMRHAKRMAAIKEIFGEEEEKCSTFTIKLYHPYLVSVTCEMDNMTGSVYGMRWSMAQHEMRLTEYETDRLKRENSCDGAAGNDCWDPLFRLDVNRYDGYPKQKVYCVSGLIRYVTDCQHGELTNNQHTFGAVATVMCTKCIVNSLKNTECHLV